VPARTSAWTGPRSVFTPHEDDFQMILAAIDPRDGILLAPVAARPQRTMIPRGSVGGVDGDHVSRHFGYSKEGNGLTSVPPLSIKLLWGPSRTAPCARAANRLDSLWPLQGSRTSPNIPKASYTCGC